MKITYRIYLVEDGFGNSSYAVADDSNVTIQICGMKSKNGTEIPFESEAYHLESWCKFNGLKYKKIIREDVISF